MSLLLEALKKSDQQRRKQAVPDLTTVHVPAAHSRRIKGVRTLVYGGLILLALGVGWWLKPLTQTPVEQTTAAPVRSSSAPAPAEVPSAVQTAPQPSVAPAPTVPTPVSPTPERAPVQSAPVPQMPSSQLRAEDYQLSMHYYVEAVPSRLVRINNVLQREGGRLSDGTEIAEIRPDGVLLRNSGAELFVPADR